MSATQVPDDGRGLLIIKAGTTVPRPIEEFVAERKAAEAKARADSPPAPKAPE